MRTIHREIVSALIFSKDGKLFQGMKDPASGGVYADCWHIPGGGVDEREELVPALIREILEETGVDISPHTIELVDDGGRGESEKILKDTGEHVLCKMHFNVYKVVLDKNADEIKASLHDDLEKYQWMNLKDLGKNKLTPPSIELFGRLGYLNKTIKAICFDLDGVYFTPKGKNSFHEALITEYGVAKEVVDDLMYRSPEMAQLVRGQITPGDFWNRVREITSITATDEELANRWVRDYEVDENVRSMVLKAKAAGYKTCSCTNNNAIRLPILIQRYKLLDDFDVIVSSHEVGQTKPHKEIFEALLNKLGVLPEELIYSDDNPERLSGAQELGIQTFVYENFAQFLNELKKHSVVLDAR